jgi:hypothetical protein
METFISVAAKDGFHIAGAAVVAVLVVAFLWHVLLRGAMVFFRLWRLGKGIAKVEPRSAEARLPALKELCARAGYAKAWQEYSETLHEKRRPDGAREVRATAPADAFFSTETLVDGPLHVEFYRHLPGILTGIGILGTFAGLIAGLQQFDAASDSPEVMKQALTGLFTNVQQAFTVSAIAIGLAMLFTILEKVVYAGCVNRATTVVIELDHLFQTGVGEEYLSALVKSSEESATQTRHLKESLVEDLKSLLTNLTEQQIAANRQSSVELGQAIELSLQEPLRQIADTVNRTTGEQSDRSAALLENLMASFMTQMRESMGGQLSGLSELMGKTASTVASVETSLRAFAEQMQSNSSRSVDEMQAALVRLAESLAQHQEEQRRSSAESQNSMHEQMRVALNRFVEAQEAAAAASHEASLLGVRSIGDAARSVADATNQSTEAARHLVDGIGRISTEAIQGMESGAGKVQEALSAAHLAAERLGATGRELSELHEHAQRTLADIRATASQTALGSQALGTAIGTLQQTSVRLESAAGHMQTEAEVRVATLRDINEALSLARQSSQDFKQFVRVLEEEQAQGVERFGKGMTFVLEKSLNRFDTELQSAAKLLADIMLELSSQLEGINIGQKGR